jgi:sugar O-acyltransferase (sialic acid O-acetyltransferase NeuD family)
VSSNQKRLAIIGSAGHAVAALDAAISSKCFEFVGWVDSYKVIGNMVEGYPILGHPDEILELSLKYHLDCIYIGISNNFLREEITQQLKIKVPDLDFATIIHPFSSVSESVTIGEGSLIMPGAIINCRTRIGNGVIINTAVSIDHDCFINDYASLLPRVTTGGDVEVGTLSCVCLGATIGHKVQIGEHAVIGAGSLVLSDIPPLVIAWGSPAKVIRTRKMDERHF